MNKKLLIIFVLFAFCNAYGQEICDNAIDDDGDGLVDLNDDECDCVSAIALSLIPNPSFEETLCCPSGEGMMDCAESWQQASAATSDYFNLCDFAAFDLAGALPPALPLPAGGEGFIGLFNFSDSYREYAGTCISGPLIAGTSYTLNFQTAYSYGDSPFLEFELYGSPFCGDLPYFGTSCPEGIGGWQLLTTEIITYETDGSWQTVTITFTPLVNMNAVAFGSSCTPIDGDGSYFYFDELILATTASLGEITTTGGWCSDDLVLTATSEIPGGTWQWYKDGVALLGETGAALIPIPYGEGHFRAVYTYIGGCREIDYYSPTIPSAAFEANNVCLGTSIDFMNTSVNPPGIYVPWQWDFDDLSTSTEESPTYNYTTAGLYNVALIALSTDPSCNDTAFQLITVSAVPNVDFEIVGDAVTSTGIDYLVCAGENLNFNDISTIDGAVSFFSWNWNFDDGTVANTQNTQHVFNTDGVFDVSLVVVAENGCADSVKYDVFVTKLTAEFVTDTVCESFPINFEDLSSDSNGAPAIAWQWYFDDETDTVFIQDPVHSYEGGGVFDVVLIVENIQGCKDTALQPVVVYNKPEPDFYASNNPTDYFNTDLELVMIYPDPESAYQWQMPGGLPEASTEYGRTDVIYPRFVAGTYTVSLIEVNTYGCIDSISRTITVLEDQMIFAPTSFTPNGDPFNADWGIYTEGFLLEEIELTVYNRWGEIVWQTRDMNDRWDGTYLDGRIVQDGTFVWHVKARDQINDEVFEYTGFVTVLK